MVRETRYLLVRNIPEKSTEESINHYFQRYGKIQNVKIQPPTKDSDSTIAATVAFMDIRSASKAHNSKNTIDSNVLRTEYWDALSSTVRTQSDTARSGGSTSAAGGTNSYGSGPSGSTVNRSSGSNGNSSAHGSWTAGSGSFQRHGGEATRAQTDSADRSRSPEHSTASSARNKKSVSMSRSASRSRSRSPRSRSGSSSSRTAYSTESSNKSCSKSQSHGSSQGSTRVQSAVVKSTVSNVSEIKDLKGGEKQKESDSEDRRPLGICITGLPARSSDSSLRDGLFHEYKKHGKVTTVQIVSEGESRHAIVSFRKPEDASKALEASQGKMFFGTKIKVTSHEGIKVEDADIRSNENDLDEYHPKSTRTLFVGNLEKDTTVQDLISKFNAFGEIIDVDIKRQGAASAYAFVQYTDISSVVQALREMEGEHIGANKIKLGFGKSMPTNCVWIDGCGENLNEKHIYRVFKKFGEVTYTFVDRKKYRALVYFTNLDDAQYAVTEMKVRPLGKRRVMIDFASRECQNNFLDRMEKTGQMRPENRPDERGLHKFRQRSFEYQEGFTEENRPRFASTGSPSTFFRGRVGRGRSRHNDSSFQDDYSPSRRNSRQSSEFSQSGSFYNSKDDYEQELRDYGHVQRERRERGHSPRRDDYDDRSRRSSREVSLDCYDSKDVYTRSSTPSSEHNSFRSERYVSRTMDDKSFRTKYEKDKSDDKGLDRLSDVGDPRGRRSPTPEDDDMGSGSPHTPLADEPFSRLYYTRDLDASSDSRPTVTVIEPKPKLKSFLVSQPGNNSTPTTPKLGSEVTLPEKSSVRKRLHEETLSAKDSSSKKKGDRLNVDGTLTLKMTPAERERQRKQQRHTFGKVVKSDARSRVKMESGLASPGSSGSHPESENGSISETELQNLQLQKQKLLVELNKEEDLDFEHPEVLSSKNCHRQMEELNKVELKLKEKQKQRLALQKSRTGGLDLDFKVSVDSGLLDSSESSPSDSKRRKLDFDGPGEGLKHSYHKDNGGVGSSVKLPPKGGRTVEISSGGKPALELEVGSFSRTAVKSQGGLAGPKSTATSSFGKTNSADKMVKGLSKPGLPSSSVVLEKTSAWSSQYGPSPEACFSPTVSEEAQDVESVSESIKSSPKPSSPLDWSGPPNAPSPAISDDSSRLDMKPSDTGLAQDSLSDSSGEENTNPGEPSLEDRIRMVDEIMNATLNKAADVSTLSTSVSGAGSPSLSTANNLSSSIYSKYRIRKRMDAQSPGPCGLTTDRKNEPSEIMQALLKRVSILDQDYSRLGHQSTEKIDSTVTVGQFGARLQAKPSMYGVGLPGRPLPSVDNGGVPTVAVSCVPPVTTATASLQLPTTTTTTTFAGQPITTVTTSAMHPGYRSPKPGSGGLAVPNPSGLSPRGLQPPVQATQASSLPGTRSPRSSVSPSSLSPHTAEPPTLVSAGLTVGPDRSHTPVSAQAGISDQDSLRLPTSNADSLRTSLPASSSSGSLNHQPTPTKQDSTSSSSTLDVPSVSSAGRSPRGVTSSVNVNSSSAVSASSSVSPAGRKDTSSAPAGLDVPSSVVDTTRSVDAKQPSDSNVSVADATNTAADQPKKDFTPAAVKKEEKDLSSKHNEGAVVTKDSNNSTTSAVATVTTTSSVSTSATSVMHSTTASTSSVTSSSLTSSSVTTSSITSSVTSSTSGKSHSDRPSKPKTTHSRSVDQTVKHDPLFAPDIKPDPPKPEPKTPNSSKDKEKAKGGGDASDKHDSAAKPEAEAKEKKSHSKSSQGERKLSKASSKDTSQDRSEKKDGDKQEQSSGQKSDRSRHESGSRSKGKEDNNSKGKEADSHAKNKEKESGNKHKEAADMANSKEGNPHPKTKDTDVAAKSKEAEARAKSKDRKADKTKDKEADSQGKAEAKSSDSQTKVRDADSQGKQKEKEHHSRAKTSEKEPTAAAASKSKEKVSDSQGKARDGSSHGKAKDNGENHNKAKSKHKEDKEEKVKKDARDQSTEIDARSKSRDRSSAESQDSKKAPKEGHKKEKEKKAASEKADEKKAAEKTEAAKEEKKSPKEEKKPPKEEKKSHLKPETKKDENKTAEGHDKPKEKVKAKEKSEKQEVEANKQEMKHNKAKANHHETGSEKKKFTIPKTTDSSESKEHKQQSKDGQKPTDGSSKPSTSKNSKESSNKVNKNKDNEDSKPVKKSKNNENEKAKEKQKKEEEERRKEEEKRREEERQKEEEKKKEEERRNKEEEKRNKEEEKRRAEEKKREEERRREEERKKEEERRKEEEKKKEEDRRKEEERKQEEERRKEEERKKEEEKKKEEQKKKEEKRREREKQKKEKEKERLKKEKEKEKQKRKEMEKEKEQKEKEKAKEKKAKERKEIKEKEKEKEAESSSSQKEDDFPYHLLEEPIFTSMYDTIKRRSCKKTTPVNEVSKDTRKRLDKLSSRRGSGKKSKARTLFDDSSSDNSDENLLSSLESDSDKSDSDARSKPKKKPMKKKNQTPVKKKRALISSSSDDEEEEVDEAALLRAKSKQKPTTEKKNFKQIFSSSSDSDDGGRDSSPERPPPKPKAPAKQPEKKSKPKKPSKKRKSAEDSNDSDLPELEPISKHEKKMALSDLSLSEDEEEDMEPEPPKKAKKKKKEEQLPKPKKTADDGPPAKKQKLSASKENLAEKKEKKEKKDKVSEKKPAAREEKKMPVLEDEKAESVAVPEREKEQEKDSTALDVSNKDVKKKKDSASKPKKAKKEHKEPAPEEAPAVEEPVPETKKKDKDETAEKKKKKKKAKKEEADAQMQEETVTSKSETPAEALEAVAPKPVEEPTKPKAAAHSGEEKAGKAEQKEKKKRQKAEVEGRTPKHSESTDVEAEKSTENKKTSSGTPRKDKASEPATAKTSPAVSTPVSESKKDVAGKQEKDKEKKEKKAKSKAAQDKKEKDSENHTSDAKDGHGRDPILQTLADDMLKEDKKEKSKEDNSASDDPSKSKPKKKKKKKEMPEKSPQSFAISSLVAETVMKQPEPEPPAPVAETTEDLDPFVSFWGHPAPLIHKKRDSIPKPDDGKEKEDKKPEKLSSPEKTPTSSVTVETKTPEAVTSKPDTKGHEEKAKPAWTNLFGPLDQEHKPLINIPEEAFKPTTEDVSEKSDTEAQAKPKKKKPKKEKKEQRKGSKEIDPLAAVEMCLEATKTRTEDTTVLLQDVIDKKPVFPERRFSYEDNINLQKESSSLFSSPTHKLDKASPKQQDSKEFADLSQPEGEDMFTPFVKPERVEKVPFSAEPVASSVAETERAKSQEDGLVHIERNERDEQAASDEAARAVQALMGGLDDDNNQFGFDSGENLQITGMHPEPSGMLDPAATPTSPSTALMDPIALQGQPETAGPVIPEAAEAPQSSTQPDVQEQSLSVMEQVQQQEEKSQPPEEAAPETGKKGQRRGKKQRSKGSKDTPQKEDQAPLQPGEIPSAMKGYFPGQSPPVLSETHLPNVPEMPKAEDMEAKKNQIDTYDFDKFEDSDPGMDLIVESALNSIQSPSADESLSTMKSPRGKNSSTHGGRGRRGRGAGSVRDTPEKTSKVDQPPQSPMLEPVLTSPTSSSAQMPVIPPWQQAIVKDDLASPESKTDLDSSYGEAELVINLEDQGTPTDGEMGMKAQYQFGSDSEDKSPAHQTSAPGSSPYKTQRPSRTRKPTNYKAMDQGLNMNIPSPRASRSGSSPRAARGGQSPKNPPTPSRGRGSSPKASNEMGSPVVKLEKLEVGRGKRGKDDALQKGRPGTMGKEMEGIENVAHQSFEDWKASNMLSTVDPKPISKDNIYEFEASEQEQKLEPSPTLRGPRGRNKRPSESSEGKTPEMLSPLGAPPPLQPAPQQGAPLGTLKELGQEEQASDDSTSSMSNVDKMIKVSSMSNVDRIIDAVSKGFFDVSDHRPDSDEKIPQRPSTGRGRGAKQAAAAAAAANPAAAAAAVLEQAAENKPEPMVPVSPSMPGKLVIDFPMSAGQEQHPVMAGPPPTHRKGKHDAMPKMSVPGEMPSFPPGFHPPGYPMHSEAGSVGLQGTPLGKAGPAMKQEHPPATTMTWQSAVSTAAGGLSTKPPMTTEMLGSSPASSQPHSIPISTQPHSMPAVSHPHGLPPLPHPVADVMSRGKKGEGLPHPPVSEPLQGPFSHMPPHQNHPQAMMRGGPPGREESSPLVQMSSMFPPGHPASMAAAAEQARRSGVFAVPSSRDQVAPPPQGLVTGPPMPRGGSHEPRYTSPKMPATPVNVITTGQNQAPATTGSMSSPAGHGKHMQHAMSSPASMPPVPALVQAPGVMAQAGSKLHGLPKAWPGAPGSLPGQQPPIQTPPPPSPSQISPTSGVQPQRPQSVQLPVAPAVDSSPGSLALKRPPSAHSSGRDIPGRPTLHQGEMRPPSLPGDVVPPPELAGKVSAAERRERDLEREREREREQQREREHLLQLASLQRQGLAPHPGHPGYYMVQGEHGPMPIPHPMVPPHSQHDPKMVPAGPSVSGAPPVSVAITTPATSHHAGRRSSVQDSVPSKMPPATSTAALFSGVVAGQPRSLSPKTASPVGQVIERLPNPMRPEGIHGPRGVGLPHRLPAPQDPAVLVRFKEDAARGIHPPAAHGEHPYELLAMRTLQQQQHTMFFLQDQAARTAAAARGVRAQELAHSSVLAHEMAARSTAAAAQEAQARKSAQETARNTDKERAAAAAAQEAANKAKEAARKEAAFQEAIAARNAAMERSIQEGLAGRVPQEGGGKGGPPPPPHSQMMGMQQSPVSVQQQPLNLADSDSRSSSAERGSSSKPPFSLPPGPHAGFMERERGGKGGDRPPPDAPPHIPSSAFVPPPGGAPGSHRDGLPVYSGELPFGAPFGLPRMPLDPRVFPGQQHHPQFLPGREGVLSASFQQFVPGAAGQRFPLDQHPDAERLLKKGELPPAALMPMGRSPSPIPSPSPRLPPDMVGHPMLRMGDLPARENLHTVLGRYPMVWQGMLALKNDQSYVQMHFVSGSKDLPEQALPRAICNQALPLRISQRMRLEQPNLEGVTKRMINEKDYTLLLAVPCGVNHMDITDQTKNLTVGFIEYLRSKLAAGIVNVSQPGTNQPAFVVHVFPPCEFSMEVVANHSQGLVEQIHDLAHVIIIITTV